MTYQFNNVPLLVVGDIMLETAWYGPIERISTSAPVTIVNVKDIEERLGGAGNIAANIKSLGGECTLLAIAGQDEAGQKLHSLLEQQGLSDQLLYLAQCQTVKELRVLSQQQQLIRLDFAKDYSEYSKDVLLKAYQTALKQNALVILSDHKRGTLSDIKTLIHTAKAANKLVLVNPASTQFDYRLYSGASILAPALREFKMVVGEWSDEAGLRLKAMQWMQDLEVEALLLISVEEGLRLFRCNHPPLCFPAFNKDIYDLRGIKEAVIAVLGIAMAAHEDLASAAYLANAAASLVINKLGPGTFSLLELSKALEEESACHPLYPSPLQVWTQSCHLRSCSHTSEYAAREKSAAPGNLTATGISIPTGILSRHELKEAVELARSCGESVVMTNGCFDLLHAGHVDFLRKAKKLGHRLLVAVNDDLSIKSLKGEHRPILPLASRLKMLDALVTVDWVIPFHEATPHALLQLIQPDLLVKGGDYTIEQIVGAEVVRAYGGQVAIVSHRFMQCSTTDILQRIKSMSEY